MKLQTKLLVGFGSLWVVLFVSTLLVLFSLKQQSASLEDAFHSNFDSVDYCGQMTQSLDDDNMLALKALWEHADPSVNDLSEIGKHFAAAAAGQSANITLPGEKDLTTKAFDLAGNYQSAFTGFVSDPESRRAPFYESTLLPKYLAARSAVQAVNELNFVHLRTVNTSLQSNLSNARFVQILFAILGSAFAIGCTIALTRTILGPLRSLTLSARQVESGNLDLAVPVRAMDELGDLAVAFNAMAAHLREYRKLGHARLQRTQQTTQLAIDSLPDAVAVLNPHGEVEIANYQARVHFGMTPETKSVEAFPDWLRELVAGPLASGRPVEPEGYHSAVQVFDNGRERFFLPRAVPMFDESGATIGVVVTLVDVTLLRRADEIKSCLVSTVSHELKTPLAAARFSAHLLAQESVAPLDPRQRRLVKAACEGTDRLHRIIQDLLQFQRFEEGRQMVRLSTVSPRSIVERGVQELRDEFPQHGLELSTDLPADLPAVNADPELANHVLTNLLSNALKFVHSGGHVRVSACVCGTRVRFAVADDGPGIPSEHVPRLFSRFYRAAAPSDISGAGLGLAIAKQLTDAQGGRIAYEPAPTGGAMFIFELASEGIVQEKALPEAQLVGRESVKPNDA